MRHLREISLFFLFLVSGFVGQAQKHEYRLEIFGTRNGLLSSKIYTLYQASNRMLWIGTEFGVSAYNGYQFTNYQYNAENDVLGRILCITEDRQHGIWFGGDKGLYRLYKGRLQKISLQSRPSIAVEALITDADGNVWIGELNALYKITSGDISRFTERPITTLPILPFADFNKRIFGLATDNQKNIYACSYDGLLKISGNQYEMLWKNPDPFKFVRSVAVISADSIYWNCMDGHQYQMIKGRIDSNYPADFIINSVLKNRNTAYALTTSGMVCLNENLEAIVSFASKANNAVAALIDAEDNIWIGTWEGLLKYRKTSFERYTLQHTEHTEIFSMLERKNGQLLFGSNRGVVFTKQNNNIIPHPSIPKLFPQAEVLCLFEDTFNTIWAGSGYQGISRFDNKRLTQFPDTGFLKDNNCEALYPAADGKLFACTEQGVTVIDPTKEQPMQAHYPFQKKYSRYPELFGAFKIAGSGYWFYGSQGLFALHNNQLVDDSITGMPVKKLYITKITNDRKGNIWIATLGKGLLQCLFSNGKIILQKQYDTKKGIPSDIALSVLVDKNDKVWWGDYMSISVLANPGKHEQISSFSESDGLLSTYYQALKLEQQKNGRIWGLTSMGMFSFDPDSIAVNKLEPFLNIDKISINGSDSNYSTILPITIAHDQNSWQFHYTAISLTDPSKIRYAYRLKELDSNWNFTASRTAAFNFLQPGQYTFELKACNNNNVWVSDPLQYHFSILPPFWQRWWFRILLAVLISGLIIFFFRRRISTIKTKAAIKQQMAELEAKAIRAQMNPHFIFNSLNAIQESIILNDYDTSYQYLSKFSKLLRQVLNNSEKNFIPLRDEIDMNRLYLELESLRFKHSFSYQIIVDEQIDADMIQFPSLMLQPFIENAIWHGLMHKDGEKKLLVRFSLQGQQLKCSIEDNGIGREKAAEIKKQKLGSQYFESKGTDLARQRIQLLKQSGALTADLVIEDLKDEAGEPAGTRVIIHVPLSAYN